jgi:hypothetical protein
VHRMPAFGLVGLRFFELVGPTADDHLRLWYESPNVIRLGFERDGAANSASCEWWSNRDLGQIEDVLVALALGTYEEKNKQLHVDVGQRAFSIDLSPTG